MSIKIEDVFRSSTASERQADANRIVQLLYGGGKDSAQLLAESGLDQVGLAKTLHYMQTELQPPLIEKVSLTDVRGNQVGKYFLTEHAKRLAASSRGVQKRVHFNGINGKISFDTDGRPIVNGKKGAVYGAITRNPPISADQIAHNLGWDINLVYTQCRDLMRMQLVEFDMDGNKRLYRPTNFAQAIDSTAIHPPLPPAPAIDVPTHSPIDKAMGRKPPTDKLTTAVLALLNGGYNATDIILTVLSEQEEELKALRAFRDEIEQRMKQ
jgi:hypothetical protein